jgi:hypothetical protein
MHSEEKVIMLQEKITFSTDHANHSNLENPGWIECIIPISILFNLWQFQGN